MLPSVMGRKRLEALDWLVKHLIRSKQPGWYFGWNIVAVSTLLTLLTVGMRLGIGPFFLPISEDLGFSRSLLAGIIAIGMLCYGLAMPLAGYLVAKYNTKTVLILGTLIVVGSIAWTIVARDPISFFLSFGVLMSVGLGFTSPVSLTPLISKWFTRQRGMALFFLSTGSMAGIALMTPVLTWAIEISSWQIALVGFAIVFLLVTIPAAFLVMRENAPAGTDQFPGHLATAAARTSQVMASITLSRAIRTMPFWKICLGLFACGFSMNLLGTHGMPMLMDHGFDAMTSSTGIGLIGLVAIFSTIFLGRLADRIPRKHILASVYLVRGLGFFALLIVGTHWELYVAAAVGGIVWAGSIAMSSAILADIYGVRLVGILYGWAYVSHQVGAMVSSWLGGWGYDHFGTHWIAFGLAGALLIVAAAISMKLPEKGYSLVAKSA